MGETVTLRAALRFRCLAGRCWSCCTGWSIELDGPEAARVDALLSGAGASYGPWREPVGAAADDRWRMRLDENGQCPFLGADRLCVLHARWGEEVLPHGCREYPRRPRRARGGTEIAPRLSCPEMARLCLVDPDGASVVREVDPGSADDLTFAEWLRDAGLALLAPERGVPLQRRLLQLVSLGEEATRDDRPAHLDGILRELLRGRGPWVAPDPPGHAAGAAALPLVWRVAVTGFEVAAPELRTLLERSLAAFGASVAADGRLAADATTVWRAWSRWRALCAAEPALRAWDDRVFSRDALQLWLGATDRIANRTPAAHVADLLVRVAVHRFLAAGHPRLAAARNGGPPRREDLDAAAVDTVQTWVRSMESHRRFDERLAAALEAERWDAPERAGAIARF